MSRHWKLGLWLALVLALYGVAVVLALDVVSPQPRLGRWYPWLAVAAALALAWLLLVIMRQFARMQQRVRRGAPGARLTRRLVWRFALIALPPALVVYGFALNFLVLTVDAWFNVRLENALDDALGIDRLYVNSQLADAEKQSARVLPQLAGVPDAGLQQALDNALDHMDALQLSVLSEQGRVEGVASADPRWITPPRPGATMLTQLHSEGRYAAAEPLHNQLVLRVLLPLTTGPGGQRVLQALYALPPQLAVLSQRVEDARFDFERLKFLRGALKLSFVLVLTFVVLLSLLAALLAAVAVARRLLAPIGQLAAATQTLADGSWDIALPRGEHDELGFLLDSFSGMADQLQRASDAAEANAVETERQRTYLQTVLERLSSGVLGIDHDGRVRSANRAAGDIIGVSWATYLGHTLTDIGAREPALQPLLERIAQHVGGAVHEWRHEVQVPRAQAEPLTLMVRGRALGGDAGGTVVVFDDQTELNRAQRDAAWAEVARRLAHEVKNPLTPIRLAAERVQHRLHARLDAADADMLARATGTIVAQVDALKALVDAFSDYARSPQLALQPLPLDPLVREVLDLYENDPRLALAADLQAKAALVRADPGKLRQLLHNVIKNALEAVGSDRRLQLTVATRVSDDAVALRVADNGPGLPQGFDAKWFEPYVSGKPQGSGLGLAVVKKIAEEHGGHIEAHNRTQGGAEFVLSLPRVTP